MKQQVRTVLAVPLGVLLWLTIGLPPARAQQAVPVKDTFGSPLTGARSQKGVAPVTAQRLAARTCTDVNTADFSGRTVGEDWKTSRTLTTEGTTVTSGYAFNGATGQSSLTVQDLTYGRVLSWNVDYTANGTLAPTNASANYVQLTLTLNRAVTGLALTINDIDKQAGAQNGDGWTDLVQFDGYATATGGSPITLSAADVTLGTNGANAWNGGTIANTVIGTANNTTTDGNVTVLFPSAVTRVVITYKNAQTTYANPGSQIIGIAGLSWCASADAYTTIAAPATGLSAGVTSGNYTATFGNNGPDNLASQTRVVTVPANTASAVSAPGATVTGSQTAGWTLTYPTATNVASGAANATSYNFTITPLAGVTPIAVTSTTTTTTDQTSTTNDQATVSTAVTPIADLTTTLTGPGSLAFGVQSGNYTVTYTNNGPSVAASTTRTVTIPRQYVSAVSAPGGTVTTSGTATNGSYTITYPAGTNVAAGSAGTVSYDFTITTTAASNNQNIAVTSTTTGTTSQGADAAPNTATVTYRVGAVSDVSATFTSPTATSTTAVAGTTVNYTVQFGTVGAISYNTTRTVSIPAGVPSVSAPGGTVTGSQATGWTITYADDVDFAIGNSASYTFSIVAPATGPITLTARTTTSSGQANTSNDTATRTLNVTPIVLSGTIFDDVNYGGGAGRTYAAANTSATGSGFANNAIARPSATVELYDASGNYVASTTSNAAGLYSFNVPSAANYTVRVVNSTVTPARAASTTTGIIGVQTYVYNDANRVGGEDPQKIDADANTSSATLASLTAGTGTTATTAQSIKLVTVPAAGLTAVDFGFNFDVITNTRDAGAGSLRQFITNANALANTNLAQAGQTAGVEASIFMISNGGTTSVPAGLRSGVSGGAASNGVATITLASALPNITGTNAGATTLTGLTQSNLYGNQSQPVAETTTGPEVIVDFNGSNGFNLAAASPRVLSLGFTGTNQGGGSTTAAISVLAGATSAVLQDNTFYNNGSNLRINGVGGATITGNISRDAKATNSDGIEMTASASNTITGNQFINNAGYGIDFIGGASTGNTITGNLFKLNGQNTSDGQTAGIGLRSGNANNNTISGNTFTQNVGDGISSSRGSVGNVFSQNSFSANGNLSIDLTASTTANDGDGVTINDNTDADTGSNNLLNFPVLTTATINTTNLVVTGYARPGAVVELYLAAADPTGFGEGQTYLITRTEGNATDDSNNGTGSYGPANINGLNQGTDNTNLFTFTIPLSSLTSAQRTALQGGAAILTSTATISGTGTSEFSGNLAVAVADVTVSITGPTTLYPGQATGSYTATFTNQGPAAASTITRTVTLPEGASLSQTQQDALLAAYPGFSYTSSTRVLDFGSVSTLANEGTSSVQFAFTAPGTISTALTLTANTSTTSSEGANNAPNAASLTLRTVDAVDVTASITANAIAAGATKGTFTATFLNNGPQNAAGVVYTVQLPTGLTGVTAGNGGSYDTNTGLVTYGSAATLNNGSTFSSAISYDLAGNSAPVTATARVTTTTDELGRTGNNVDYATMGAAFDLTTTLTGPSSVIAGSPTMLYVTTTNSGPNTAATASQTVTIPAGLSGVYISNGGSYNSGNGQVTFPILSNLPSGQTITNSISFLAPTGSFSPSAQVSTTSGTETNTGNNTASLSLTAGAATGTNSNMSTIITANAAVVAAGTDVTYTVRATNNGPTAVSSVVERVQLLPGLSTTTLRVGGAAGTVTGTDITFTGAVYNTITGILTYSTLTTGNGTTVGSTNTFPTITVTMPATAGNAGQLLATASVSANLSDNVPSDNVSSVVVKVRTTPDVATTISGPSSTVAGLPVAYVVRFANSGATDAATVTETAQLPAGLTGVTITDIDGNPVSGATYASATGLVTFPSVSSDATGATQTFVVTLPAPAQNFPVTSSIASVTADGVSSNNSAALNTSVTANNDLAVTVTGPATATAGNPVTYIVATANNGPSTASNVVTTLQLPTGLTFPAGGLTGGANYVSATGLLTFPATTTLVPGGSTLNYATFIMPTSPSNGYVSGLASVSNGASDAVQSNNTAGLTTSVAPATTELVDVLTSISLNTPTGNPSSVPAGTVLEYVAAYRNNSGSTATNVVPTVNLPVNLTAATLSIDNGPGTQSGNVITYATGNGPVTYNTTTGLLTFPTIASLPVGPGSVSYRIGFPAPVGSGQLVVSSAVTSALSESDVTNNRANSSITINTVFDVTTSLAGPATAPAGAITSYTVTTQNGGPSLTSTTTTQTVTLPAGVTATAISGNGTQNGTSITWTIAAGQAAGVANAVTNTFSVAMPASGSLNLTAAVTSAGETVNTLTNNAALTTTQLNRAPVAQNIVNALQTARGNTSTTALAISSLNATDVDGSIASYTITALPVSGTLYYNGAVATTAAGLVTDPTKLSYVPAAGFVGNAFFTYAATDNSGLVSPAALYTIPVAQDQNSTYATFNTAKGGANKYVTGDVLAQITDLNTATYVVNTTGSGPATAIFNPTTGVLLTNAANGLPTTGTNAVLVSGTLPSGVSLDAATGRIFVSNASQLVNGASRSYTVTVRTTDSNGGVNTVTTTFTIGNNPLPVTLTSFTAQAAGQDAKLAWTTAQEVNNDHFVVERSFDGQSFATVKQVKGQGTKATATTYAEVDAQVAAKAQGRTVYYRLRQVDTDGTETFSAVQSVSFPVAAQAAVEVYPNPATTQQDARLDLSGVAAGTYQVTITDMAGRTVRSFTQQGGSNQFLNVTQLPTGSYLIQVRGNNQSFNKRLVKE